MEPAVQTPVTIALVNDYDIVVMGIAHILQQYQERVVIRRARHQPGRVRPGRHLVETFIGPLVRVDRDGRYAAEWHDRVDRDGCAEGRLRRVTPSFQRLEGRAGHCSS
jgi:hypothetical protein